MDRCRDVMRFRQMSQRMEQSYVDWIRRFSFVSVLGGIERSEPAVLRAESLAWDSLGWSAQRGALLLEFGQGNGDKGIGGGSTLIPVSLDAGIVHTSKVHSLVPIPLSRLGLER